MDVDEINLSLNGCGYIGIYHVGVCACIKKYYPQILRNKISGGSVGALVASGFMCDVPAAVWVQYVFDVSMQVRKGILGPMSPDLKIMPLLYDSMDRMLPPDAHLRCDGRLYISVTRFDNGQNVLLNRFDSKEELLQALMCSCFIPVYCGYEPPRFRGVAYVDAALSNNSPVLNKHTLTVAPFAGDSDICPENDGFTLTSFKLSNTSIGVTPKNLYMMFRVLFPGSMDIQKDFCQRGYNDALRFLRDNDLISCPDCGSGKTENGHLKCRLMEQPMPRDITDDFDSYIQEFRKNLSYRLLQYKSVKVLYYMNMPSIVTAKVTYAALSAILQKLQNKAGICVEDVWCCFLQFLKVRMNLLNARHKRHGTNNFIKDPENDSTHSESKMPDNEESEMDYEKKSTALLIKSSTNVEIAVPENNPASSFPDACVMGQCINDSYKLDLQMCNNKIEISGTL